MTETDTREACRPALPGRQSHCPGRRTRRVPWTGRGDPSPAARTGWFVRGAILEQRTGPAETRIVTVVEWARSDVVGGVAQKVAEMHRAVGFDRREMMARLGIQADIGSYRRIDI